MDMEKFEMGKSARAFFFLFSFLGNEYGIDDLSFNRYCLATILTLPLKQSKATYIHTKTEQGAGHGQREKDNREAVMLHGNGSKLILHTVSVTKRYQANIFTFAVSRLKKKSFSLTPLRVLISQHTGSHRYFKYF